MTRMVLIVAGVVAFGGAAWRMAPSFTGGQQSAARKTTASSADERQRELLKENLDKPGDPLLARRFAEINAKHFSNVLKPLPVIWEPRLTEVGDLAGRSFTLLGVFGQSGDKSIILLHPSLKDDPAAIDRALSHEMIHAYLFSIGETGSDHGPEFLAVLHRLSSEGAFVSIEASPAERAQMREWLANESGRIEAERAALDRLAPEIERERVSLEQAIAAVRSPTANDVANLTSRKDAYNERAAALNQRSSEFRAAQEEYNRQVARYNLMATYPDGLDDPAPPAKRR